MFKSALSSLSSTVVGAARETIKSYSPSNIAKEGGAFERITQQGIANLSYRSPIMADLAQTMLHNFQLEMTRKAHINEYIKSDSSQGLRGAVQGKLGPNVDSKKIDAEMYRILSKITKSIDREGVEETKKTSLFKEYEKYFMDFKKGHDPKKEESEQKIGPAGIDSEILNRIESNTHRTFNALEELSVRGGLGGAGGSAGNGVGGRPSFIDPVTGAPSMRAAVGSIGGSFLTQVFDDATIEKFAKKTKNFLGFDSEDDPELAKAVEPKKSEENTSESIEPKKSELEKAVEPKKSATRYSKPGIRPLSDIIGDLNLDLNTSKDDVSVFDKDAKKIGTNNSSESAKEEGGITKVSTENTSESAHEIENVAAHRFEKDHEVQKSILSELEKLNKSTDKIVGSTEEKEKVKKTIIDKLAKTGKKTVLDGIKKRVPGVGSVLDKIPTSLGGVVDKAKGIGGSLLSTVGDLAGSAVGRLAPMVGAALPYALPALGVAAAGAGGYMLGKHVINPLLDKGITAVTGKENSLGTALYDAFNKDTGEQNATTTVSPERVAELKKIAAAKSDLTSNITKLSEQKDKQSEESKNTSVPIVLNNSTSTQSRQEPTTPTIIAGTNVRNTESTFERVQMQDFWNRTA